MTGRMPLLDSLKALVVAGTNKGYAWDLRSGSLYDFFGGRTLTPAGSARLQRNGGAVPVGGTDRFQFINTAMIGNELTCWMLINHGGFVAADGRLLVDNSATQGFFLGVDNTFRVRARCYTNVGGVPTTRSTAFTAGFALTPGKTSLIIGTAKGGIADGLRCYLDGVPVTHAAIDLTTDILSWQAGIAAFPSTTAAASGNGLFQAWGAINKRLSDAEVATLYDEIVNQIKYETNNLIINSTYPTIGSSVWEARYGLLAGEQTMSAGQDIGQLASLKVSTGTHKATTILYGTTLAKAIECVTAGNIILPDPRPDIGTTWAYQYYDASAGTWAARTSATATVALDDVGDRILWATQDGRNSLRKY